MPKSGTTLVGSLIAQHPQVAGVVAERYGGLKEADIFGGIEIYFGEIGHPVELIRFVETFGASDYFRRTGVAKEIFYQKKPGNIATYFRILMEDYAQKNNCSHWVEKSPTHLLCFERVLEAFPDALIVVVVRDPVDCIRSQLALHQDESAIARKIRTLKVSIHYAIYRSRLDDLKTKVEGANSITLEFKTLVGDIAATSRQLCDFLGLPHADEMSQPVHKKNTSFFSEAQSSRKRKLYTWKDRILFILALNFCRSLPIAIRRWIAKRPLVFAKRPMAHHWGMLLEENDFVEKSVAPGSWGGLPENRPKF